MKYKWVKQHLLCFYARKRANIWCQYIANLRGVWCDTFISICKQSKHQSTSDAGRAGLQTDTNRYKTLISAQRFSRRIQEGATQRNDRWEKELMQKLWISAPSFLLPRGQSNNWSLLLLQYVDWIHLVYPGQPGHKLRYYHRRVCYGPLLPNGALNTKITWHFWYFFWFCYFASIYQYLAPLLH